MSRHPSSARLLGLGAAFVASMGLALVSEDALAQTLDNANVAQPAVAAALSPEQAAIEAQLGSGRWDPAVSGFYADRQYRPVWTGADAAKRRSALVASLTESPAHALPTSQYDLSALQAAEAGMDGLSPDVRAKAELAYTTSFLRYAQDISSGVLEPRKVDRELYVYPEKRDKALLLSGIATASDPATWMRDLAPADPGYYVLLDRYRTYTDLQANGGWGDQLNSRKTLRVGDRSQDVVVLRARLSAMGFMPSGVAAKATDVQIATAETANDANQSLIGDPWVFDAALAEGVKAFQAHHGLNLDGAVGPATRAALNVDPGFRAAQIAVNLERMRWLNKDLGSKHILVNLASFDMVVMDRGERAFESRVVVGKAKRHRTPEFSDEMELMVINPTWHVPTSIAHGEILPKLREDPMYLERQGMRVTGVEDPLMVDWHAVTPATFPGRVKQGPGNSNALGRVKFLFPNDHAIYLHDTPSKSLFKKDMRAYSHGCVRVQRPFEFAEYLLSAQRDDPKEFFESTLRRGRERYVNLDEHIPVHLTYRTAWVDSEGNDQFRADIYGRDVRILAALEGAGVVVPAH
ncbi:L,D-transpeptidase family protein [Rhodobacteraceae bacterium NNCM2]|nr:L,D-transpeptidase family protein [Coraliihabitans acroporae]